MEVTSIQIADDGLPAAGLVRLQQFIGLLPLCRSSWLRGVKAGRFPQPLRLGPKTVAWRVADIRRVLEHGADAVEAA